jgi:hypothetical protein
MGNAYNHDVVSLARYTSIGKCNLCGGTFGKGGMTRHLRACRERRAAGETPLAGPEMRQGRVFHIVVGQRGSSQYWMHLDVPATATLSDLDRFLRRTWLECCGHMSAFEIAGVRYYSELVDGLDGEAMYVYLGKLLAPGVKFYHEYDFGTSTDLALSVASEREDLTDGRSIRVLARNDAPEFLCGLCGNLATFVCVQCVNEDGGSLCDACARVHLCDEGALLPVVNSPRVGVCGYTGQRDSWR